MFLSKFFAMWSIGAEWALIVKFHYLHCKTSTELGYQLRGFFESSLILWFFSGSRLWIPAVVTGLGTFFFYFKGLWSPQELDVMKSKWQLGSHRNIWIWKRQGLDPKRKKRDNLITPIIVNSVNIGDSKQGKKRKVQKCHQALLWFMSDFWR